MSIVEQEQCGHLCIYTNANTKSYLKTVSC